jgi:hypothetical protein
MQRVTLVRNVAVKFRARRGVTPRLGVPPNEMGGPLPGRPGLDRSRRNQVIEAATLLSTFWTLPPTLFMPAIAAIEISAAISVYSIAVAPCSLFIKRRKMDSIGISKEKERSSDLDDVLARRPTVLGTNDAT